MAPVDCDVVAVWSVAPEFERSFIIVPIFKNLLIIFDKYKTDQNNGPVPVSPPQLHYSSPSRQF